jgi:hypothetical protein
MILATTVTFDFTPVINGFVDQVLNAVEVALPIGGPILALFVGWKVIMHFLDEQEMYTEMTLADGSVIDVDDDGNIISYDGIDAEALGWSGEVYDEGDAYDDDVESWSAGIQGDPFYTTPESDEDDDLQGELRGYSEDDVYHG